MPSRSCHCWGEFSDSSPSCLACDAQRSPLPLCPIAEKGFQVDMSFCKRGNSSPILQRGRKFLGASISGGKQPE